MLEVFVLLYSVTDNLKQNKEFKLIQETLQILKNNSDLIIATMAFLAFLLSLWQGYSNRKHNRMTIKPALCHWLHSESSAFNFSVTNNGFGPAVVKDFKLFVDGSEVGGLKDTIIEQGIKQLFSQTAQISTAHLNQNYVIAPNQTILIAQVNFLAMDAPSKDEIKKTIERARLLISYESGYGDKFLLDTDT